ncbi:MAG: hypothetical protein K5924_02750 [Chloroflexi bacterium]|nr:hypothetical protein [Chloroflexota bacterium]
MPRTDLPSGTVTFLFTDVEGSTKLLHELGAEAYAGALADHRRILRDAFTALGGVEVDTQGDAFFIAFPTAAGALEAATTATEALHHGPIRVRMGLHTGTPLLTAEGYVGLDVHKGARIAAAGHGGQILVSADTAMLLADAPLRDLGLHRFKDLTAPERVFQVGDEDHPRLKTLHQTNLPIPVTPFVGRAKELADLGQLLADPANRLVTLTGPGGSGKTRLGLHAAAAASDHFPDGVWWIPLAPLRDPSLVAVETTRALDGAGDPAEVIGARRLLLFYDNFEQLMDAAQLVGDLLIRCPNLTVLVTSREPLRIGGEHEYAVDPLDPAQAVELFTTRALAVKRDFIANGEVARICARLDHLPLAIELAAARVKLLSPQQLLERLEHRLPLLSGGARDLPERQRTLRATIEWSHELLSDDEQALFARLAVFRGGCTLEAAEAVVDADLDTVGSLVDKSLVRVRDDRFWMLETIREYAVERLEALGEADALRARHAEHFAALAEELYPSLRGDPKEALDRLELEHDNLRAALDHLAASGDGASELRVAGALWKFWNMRAYVQEGIRRLEHALGADGTRSAERVQALIGLSGMVANEDPDRGLALGTEALEIARALDDRSAIANARFMLGNNANEGGRFGDAVPHLEEALALFNELGDDHYAMLSRFHLGWAADEVGDFARAQALDAENLEAARAAGNVRTEAITLDSLAWRQRERFGDLPAALENHRSALRIFADVGETATIPSSLGRIALIYAMQGRAADAARLHGRSTATWDELGVLLPGHAAERVARIEELLGEQLSAADAGAALSEGRSMTTEQAISLALDE